MPNCKFLLLVFAFAIHLLAAPGDERWGHEFFAPEFGTVNAVVYATNGDLICGGSFTFGVAGVAGTQNIARWDGTNWSSIGGGIPGPMFALAISGNDIIAGGSFTSVQGQNITNLARWDGTNWTAVGGGLTGGSVRTLAVHDEVIYAGGYFARAGTNAVGYIARWDGTNWNNLGGGVQASSSTLSAPVQSLLWTNETLYAGGSFLSAGGIPANNIARWTGSGWESLGTGTNNGLDSAPLALAADADGNLYVGGYFRKAGTKTVNYIAKWNGADWSDLSGGVSDPMPRVSALQFQGTNLYVAGSFLSAGTTLVAGLARWDGAAWHAVNAPLRHPALALAVSGSRIVVSASLRNVMTHLKNGLVQFDGHDWSILGAGIAGDGITPRVQTVVSGGGGIQVSGFFDGLKDALGRRQMVAIWNSKGWSNFGDGLFQLTVETEYYISSFLSADGVIYAAGKSFLTQNGVAVLSNNVWMDIGAPLENTGYSLAHFGGQLFAGHGNGISRWSGIAWTNVGSGLGGPVYALAIVGAELYAGGTFTNSGSTVLSNIARWDGTNWSSVGSGVNGTVRTLAVWQNDLYVGGEFTEADGSAALRVAKWRNSAWTAFGEGFNDSVRSLCVLSNGSLFAGGQFTQSGANLVSFIAAWNGTNWSPLGSGVNGSVLSLASDEYDLFVGGSFTTAGGVSSLRFARWHIADRMEPVFHLRILGPPTLSQVPLRIEGSPGARFALEASTNLVQWTGIQTNMLTESSTNMSVPTEGYASRFYRLLSLP